MAKTDLEDLGEEEDEFTKTTSKLRDLVKGLTGFDIMEDENTFKDIYEIILGIGKEWKNLSDIEQASLGEALAGKRNANALYAVLNNIETLEQAYEYAEDSANSAAREQENYMKSIQYSIDVFKASVQDLWHTLLDNGTIKQFVDFGTSVIDWLNDVAKQLGPGGVKGVLLSLVPVLGTILKLIKTDGSSFSGISTGLEVLKDLFTGETLANAITKITNEAKESDKEVGGLVSILQKLSTVTSKASDPAKSAGVAMAEMATGAEAAATSNAALTLSFTGLLPVLIAVGALITGALLWDHFTTTVKEAEAEIDKVTGRIDNLKNQIEELEKIDYRTAAQEERLQNLQKELEAQEAILQVEQRRVNLEKYGDKFSDYFDKDNLRKQYIQEMNISKKGSALSLEADYRGNSKDIEKLQKEISGYEQKVLDYRNKIANGDLVESVALQKIEQLQDKINKKTDKLNKLKSEQSDIEADINSKALEYQANIEEIEARLKDARENPLYHSQSEIDDLEERLGEQKRLLDRAQDLQKSFTSKPVLEGVEDYSKQIESAFKHVSFEGVEDRLIEIGKAGNLNKKAVEDVLAEYPKFINVLKDAGVDTENQIDDIYAYIMNKADPNRVERDQLTTDIANNIKLPQFDSKYYTAEYYAEQFKKRLEEEFSKEQLDALVGLGINLNDFSTMDAEDAIEYINKLLKEAGPAEVPVEAKFSNQDFSENLTTKLADLQKSYESFITDVQNGEQKAMDLDSLESMRKDLVKTGEQLGVTEEQFKAFEDVVGNSTSTAQEMQDAYDTLGTQLANVYFDKAAEETGNLDDKTKQLIKDQLILKGFTEESVDKYVEYKSAINGVAKAFVEESEARKQMSEADKAEEELLMKKRNEQIQNDLKKAPANISLDTSSIHLDDYKKQIEELKTYLNDELHEAYSLGVDLNRTVYQNVNTDEREILRWTSENIEKYKDALLSYVDAEKMSQKQIENYLNSYKDTFSTVDASSKIFTYEGVGGQTKSIGIAYTPLLQTGTGEPIYLDQTTLLNYINSILDKVGPNVTPEEIKLIDSEGLEEFEVNGVRIKNIIAGIGDEAELVAQSMHFTGVDGSIESTRRSLDGLKGALDSYIDKMSEAGHSGEELEETSRKINELREEIEQIESDQAFADFAVNADANLQHFAEQLGVTSDSLIQYTAQMMIANGTDINNQESVAELQRLMASSGLTTEVITKLIRVMEIYQTIASGVLGTNTQAVAMAKQEVQTILDEIAHMEAEGMTLQEGMDFDPTKPKNKNTGGGGGGSKEKTISEQFEEELKKLKEQYDRGEIDLVTYLNAYKALIEKYFSDTEKYAEERAKALHDYMQELKGYYDSAISGVTTLIDHRIKAVQKQKDAALKAIEDERKAAKAAYEERKKEIEKEIKARQSQIKEIEKAKEAVQAEIDKINQANKERENAINLQKSLYELERAQQQRTKLIVIYVNLHSNVMIIKVTISVKALWVRVRPR